MLPFQDSDASRQRPPLKAQDLAGPLLLFSSECRATQGWSVGRAAGSVAWELTETLLGSPGALHRRPEGASKLVRL